LDTTLHGKHLEINPGFCVDQKTTDSGHPQRSMNHKHYASLNISIQKCAFIMSHLKQFNCEKENKVSLNVCD
jgi:hypothetical protein